MGTWQNKSIFEQQGEVLKRQTLSSLEIVTQNVIQAEAQETDFPWRITSLYRQGREQQEPDWLRQGAGRDL